ncbi:hypothetical protein NJB18091_30180 [Mycobacterium marinum]|uniref:hypothetical protein n=1 Tax=Mycobacterium marinum TaxID=1781 RepID=UPI0021C4074B|nr:hypothetical protein [Mycobacterium marinum]GJN99552.1 hypothetical protein NJB18091_30180 [Mycobacterium marinum]
MATRDLTRQEAAALYEQKLRESYPDKELEARIDEYAREAEGRIFAEKQLREWWERLSTDQRAHLKKAAKNRKLESETVDLLVSTRCPVGPVGTKWEADPAWSWSWPENVQTFITRQ